MGTDAALLHPSSSQNQKNAERCGASLQTDELSQSTELSGGTPGKRVALSSEEGAAGSDEQQEETENMDEDDLPTEQTFHSAEHSSKPPPAVLREIDRDGNEIITSDHRTSAGFTFRNTLMFELD